MDHYPSYWMWDRRDLSDHPRLRSTPGDSWDQEQAFAEDSSLALGGSVWPPRSYTCSFCRREFRSAQALGGHMNVHRRDRARLKQSSDNMVEDQVDHHHQHAVQLHNPLYSDVGAEYPPQIGTNEEVSHNSYKHKTLVSPAYSFGAIIGVQQETHQRNLFSFMSSTLSSHKVVVSDSNHVVEDSSAEKNKFMSNQVQKEFVPKSDGVDSCCLVDSTRKRRQRSVDEDGVEEEDKDIHKRRPVVDLSLSFSILNDNVSDSEKRREETSLLCFLEPSSGPVRRHVRSEIAAAHSSSEHLDLELRLGGFPKFT